MINSTPDQSPSSEAGSIDSIVSAGPGGAMAVAAVATAIVVALWFGFYWLVFLPRAVVP